MRPSLPGNDSAWADPSSVSSSLLQRIKSRQPDAWQQLVDLYGPLVYMWCRQSGLQAADAGDVLQEAFGAVATHIVDFRRDRPGDSFRGWLWTITRNKIHDHFRRRQGQPQAAGGTDAQQQLAQIPDRPPRSFSTDDHTDDKSSLERRAMELVRAGVEDRTWQAFWRVTVDGQPAAGVAEDLGMSVPAVYKAKYRVLQRIRRELADLIE